MKKNKEKKQPTEEKSLKKSKSKEKFGTKFVNIIKKRWLITGTNTILLIVILIAAFILLNKFVESLELTPLDFTSQKIYTLTNESKERVKDINQKVNIYFAGYGEDNTIIDLAKQYTKANSNINIETVDVSTNLEFANKYNLTSESSTIIVENEQNGRNKEVTQEELYTYDSSYNTVDTSEEALTSAILTVVTEDIPNVYFLEGYNTYLTLNTYLSGLSTYLKNEVVNTQTLNLLVKGSVPDDCDTLVIVTPEKDFEDVVADAILAYINKGGKIVWLNGAYGESVQLTNVNRVLETYGVAPFETGIIVETNQDKMLYGTPYVIIPEIEHTDITSAIYDSYGLMLVQATKINVKDDTTLENLNVQKTDLLTASSSSYFLKDFNRPSLEKTNEDESGEFTIGALFEQTISSKNEENSEQQNNSVVSKLILIGESNFITSFGISEYSNTTWVDVVNNKDMVLNSIAYLNEQESSVTIRKSYTTQTTFEPTEQEATNIRIIIFAVPVAIIFAGIIVWIYRKRRY